MTHDPTNLRAHQLMQRIGTSRAEDTDLPEGLRELLREMQDSFLHGTADTCRHSPSPTSTMTAFVAAWRRGLIACEGCFFLLDRPGPLTNLTCNVCHAAITGDSPDRHPWSAGIQLDQLIVMVDLCTRCIPLVTPDPPPPTPQLRMRIGPRGRRGKGRGKGGRQ